MTVEKGSPAEAAWADARAANQRSRPILVSFSGMDGCGKTTQIQNLRALLAALGMSQRLVTFWDDVVVLSRYREGFVHVVYGSERGIGSPERPVNRRDKNVRAWYLTLLRHLLYLLDAIHLSLIVWRARRSPCDVVIFDRYIYDEWANLPLNHSLTRLYLLVMKMIVPQPDLALLLDADPDEARARKPEYPLEFLHKCRRAYFELAHILSNITAVPPLPLPDAKQEVELLFMEKLQGKKSARTSHDTAPAA
jgi:thymidylate kinase